MREIKFRGFSISKKAWVYGFLWVVPGVDLYYILTGRISKDSSIEKYEIYPESIGQYTGSKDRNGMEIYEGDLLEDEENLLWEVEFRDGCFIAANVFMPGSFYIAKDMVKVGNKYENPELMEGWM